VLQLVSVVLCLSAVAALREARVSYLWVLLQLLWVKVELCPLKVVRPTPVNLAAFTCPLVLPSAHPAMSKSKQVRQAALQDRYMSVSGRLEADLAVLLNSQQGPRKLELEEMLWLPAEPVQLVAEFQF
jgi:hypothetical protein